MNDSSKGKDAKHEVVLAGKVNSLSEGRADAAPAGSVRTALDPHVLRAALDASVAATLRAVAVAVAIVFAVLTLGHLLIVSRATAAWMVTIAAATSLGGLAIAVTLRYRPINTRWAHPLSAGLAGLVLLTCLLPVYLLGEPVQTTNVMIFVVGIGCLLLSTPWLCLVLGVTWLGWLAIMYSATPAPGWLHFGFGLFSATALSVIVHLVRVRSLSRVALLHAQDQDRQRQLEAVLDQSEVRVQERTRELVAANATLQAEVAERQRAEMRTAALLAVAEDIGGTLDRPELLQRVQRRAAEILGCEMVGTFYWTPEVQAFRVISHFGVPESMVPAVSALSFPAGEPFGGRLMKGETIVINDVAGESPVIVGLFAYFQLTAMIASPLSVHGRFLGNLVACTSHDRAFTDEQVEVFKGIARQLAVALEIVDLYKQQQEDAVVAAVLARVGQAMIASFNTPLILERLCQLSSEALDSAWSCAFLYQAEQRGYVLAAHWGVPPTQLSGLESLALQAETVENLTSQLHEAGIMVGPRAAVQDLLPELPLCPSDIEQALVMRLCRGQEFVGFLLCGYQQTPAVAARHKRIAQGTVQIASLALVNAQLLEELDRANRIKEDFLGTMSHELRTPLGVIMGYCQLMAQQSFGPLTPEQLDILQRIDKNAHELLDLIVATLDLSRLQNQQRVSLTVQMIPANTLLADLEHEMRQLQQKATVTWQWQVTPNLPVLATDVVKLKMVLKNLLTNALKFTDTGTITVAATSRQGGVDFVVTDTGIGIARDSLALIFEPFRQVSGSTARRHGGVGLGLSIVYQLIKLLGGTIAVDSEVGRGTTFRVWIPASVDIALSDPHSTISQQKQIA